MRFFYTFIVMILLTVTTSPQARACIAVPMAPPGFDRAAESDVVFTGLAVKTRKVGEYNVTTFKIIKKTKGIIFGREVKIKHRTTQKFCELPVRYKLNQEHIIYASRNFLGSLYVEQPSYMKF